LCVGLSAYHRRDETQALNLGPSSNAPNCAAPASIVHDDAKMTCAAAKRVESQSESLQAQLT
jgi:hypothetical protein